MISVESLKAKINALSKSIGVSTQVLWQNYMLEHLLYRIEKSEYADNFILKGGLLIANLVSVENRTTMDMDAMINALNFTESDISKMIKDVCDIEIGDGIVYKSMGISSIREGNPYGGFRIKLKAELQSVKVDLSLDLSSGDPITPGPVIIKYKSLFDLSVPDVRAYNIETVLAEKLHTIFLHGVRATRMRDYYDVYLLSKRKGDEINYSILSNALKETAKYRGSADVFNDYFKSLDSFAKTDTLKNEWMNFVKKNVYVEKISLVDAIDAVRDVMNQVCKIGQFSYANI